MAGHGELYKRTDGKWSFRVRAKNLKIVATDGSQGYSTKRAAHDTLEKLIRGDYNGEIKEV
jgi:uncharacterized protein YegP (UPF0339 family)